MSRTRTRTTSVLLATVLVGGTIFAIARTLPAQAGTSHHVVIPAPAMTLKTKTGSQAVLAGGCFWGMEMVFQHVDGVRKVVAGYAGGSKATAHYYDTSTSHTRHAESVRIFYDPKKISYGELLRIYFSVAHDPTQVNRQGPDVGPQYRSEIFALDSAQEKVATAYVRQLDRAGVFSRAIATQVGRIQPDQFYPAETYHQNYGLKHPNSLYIRINDQPKVRALAEHFPAVYRATPQVVTGHSRSSGTTG
ncbi:MAG: peptide-methionine (S)-S-oxide reductase [Nevskiaceae bacterium]|nr:MAG: peptide-methionine (S)-S-oxide reductase [Nevskiaceae bacterium]TBR72814.1 MAG: peptide-methionine (S)-S-oxide reductase [Nevskiaceae bacterium]